MNLKQVKERFARNKDALFALELGKAIGRAEGWDIIIDAAERGGFYNTAQAYREEAKAERERVEKMLGEEA